jgi:hypothetical protein
LPDFLGTAYQNVEKQTKQPEHLPIGRKTHQGHKLYHQFPFQDFPNYNQIGILGMQVYHLATLAIMCSSLTPFACFRIHTSDVSELLSFEVNRLFLS